MTRKQALMDLRDKVAAGEFDYRTYPLDKVPQLPNFPCFIDAYHGSLDAALALHNAVLPKWVPNIYGHKTENWRVTLSSPLPPHIASSGMSDLASRAFLFAILSALIAGCDE